MGKSIAIFVLLFVCSTAYAADITVGGPSGWTTGFNYGTWAASQTFTTSDTLVFNFGPSHALDEVSQSDYNSCNPSNSIISTTASSPARISLTTTTSTRYFICPRSNHCQNGMKLAVTISSGGGGSTPAPPSGNPAAPETPTTTTTPQPPPPPPPSAASNVLASGAVGFLVVIGAMFGFMG